MRKRNRLDGQSEARPAGDRPGSHNHIKHAETVAFQGSKIAALNPEAGARHPFSFTANRHELAQRANHRVSSLVAAGPVSPEATGEFAHQ